MTIRSLAQIIGMIALIVLHREWRDLRAKLRVTYLRSLAANEYRPSVLAEQLLISGEDHRYFQHGGVDPIALCRVIWRRAIRRRWEGASTIEMQVVRVVSGRFERTLSRKLREIALATLVGRVIPKEHLPGIYLRIGYFGWQMTGFDAVCRRLGASTKALIPFQVASVVARLKYPQPRLTQVDRWNQINRRAQHLLDLHARHRRDRTYAGLVEDLQYEAV